MSERALPVAVVCALALGLTIAAVPGAVAQSGSVTVDAASGPVEVGTGTETHSVTVTNDRNESVSIDVSSASGISVDPDRRTVPAKTTARITLEIDADDDAGDGTVTVSAGRDSDQFQVVRPAIAGLAEEPLDIGGVVVGDSASGEVAIEELTGEESLSYVDATVVSTDPDADLGVSASGTTLTWNAYADSGVAQHEDLSWEVELVPNGNDEAARTVEVEGNVIYPAEFGAIELDDEMTFDEPRDSTSTITKIVELEVENAGDLPLVLDDVTAYSSNAGIDVSVANQPETIDGWSQRAQTVELAVTADTRLEEGEYAISGTVSSTNLSATDTSYEGTVSIEHGTELDAPDRIEFGDVPIGEPERQSTSVGEVLGYNTVENLEITLEDGPDRWLTIEESPGNLDAGGSQPVVYRAAFDTDAELGTSYEWTYVVDGNGVDERTVIVVASPVPLDLDPIRQDVSTYEGPVADRTVAMIDTMDDRMRSGDVSSEDVTTVLSYGSAASLYLESMEGVRERQSAGEYEAAQTEIVQAAAAYNTMTLYAAELDGAAFRADSDRVLSTAEGDLETAIGDQEAYYEERLESGNVSLVEEATIQRQLARVVSLQGDDERAATLEASAESSFENYTAAVSRGERARQRAEETWSTMESEQFLTVAGQPLLLNPAKYDAYTDGVDEMNAAYENATTTFEAAGESSRAADVAAQHESRTATLQVTRVSLFGSLAVYALAVLGIVVRTARGTYWYLRDARESISGDFLV
ncbi:hypothetical protein [Natrinema salaciae]|uniref:NPCBM-associated, NEW3 domain of alpha-galactosidase n=1 Tax=Natrinema salaciae TaxID=1186196 RepID=A0A1H9NNE9_9EURY|nr:hypothetical protein [Natrinema salaciae]SER37432.1 hypothetical protein SAMN04489841_3670 [Natrinema salaciae]